MCFQATLLNQPVNRRLAMLFLYFRQNDFGRIAVVPAADTDLNFYKFARSVQCHDIRLQSGCALRV